MRDGSDAVADWPFLNAMLTPQRRVWVSIHNGGGVGIGYSHTRPVIVADGTTSNGARIERVLTNDPASASRATRTLAILEASTSRAKSGVKIPMK